MKDVDRCNYLNDSSRNTVDWFVDILCICFEPILPLGLLLNPFRNSLPRRLALSLSDSLMILTLEPELNDCVQVSDLSGLGFLRYSLFLASVDYTMHC